MRYTRLILITLCCALLVSPAQALTAKEVYQAVGPSVFTIYEMDSQKLEPVALGNGVAITKTTLVTGCQVAIYENNLLVKMPTVYEPGKLIFKDQPNNLCLIEVRGASFRAVKLRQSSDVAIGEDVHAIGSSEALGELASRGTLTDKISFNGTDIILKTDAAILPGANGSGLFDSNGNLIGITLRQPNDNNTAIIIPSEQIIKIVSKNPTTHLNKLSIAKNINKQPIDLTSFGAFGENQVGLYYYGNSCYIYMNGSDDEGNIKSSALWSPEQPHKILIFQYANSAGKTFDILDKQVLKEKSTKLISTQNNLILEGDSFKLLSKPNANNQYPFLSMEFTATIVDSLIDNSDFSTQFKNPDDAANDIVVKFGLNGFGQALEAYNMVCKIPDSKTLVKQTTEQHLSQNPPSSNPNENNEKSSSPTKSF